MKVAFFGVRRPYGELSPDYIRNFNKYHLEIPFYFAEHGGNDVTVTTLDYTSSHEEFTSGGRFRNIKEYEYSAKLDGEYDVVVHWRKWFSAAYVRHEKSLHIVHTCDHSYPSEWVSVTLDAFRRGELYGLDCYPTWHVNNLSMELGNEIPRERLLDGFTFGVDTSIYKPGPSKDPYSMLWSSDPGRGLHMAVQLAIELFKADRRFRLHVCHPDYTKHQPIVHPAIVWHGFVPNGPDLWSMFNDMTSILPYTSTFREPSSRAFRQAQAAGSIVLYPPNTGSPSEFIINGVDGYVEPIGNWKDLILDLSRDEVIRNFVSSEARRTAVSENWETQASRFNKRMKDILQKR